ncbi:hypothetical protein ACFE04_007332 [Oxalis oulophora]
MSVAITSNYVCIAAILLGMHSKSAFAQDVATTPPNLNDITGLQRIDDGSVVSNEHTAKWRVFTDTGRDYFLQGKLKEAEKFFVSALQEAKEGFGDKDPHVASSYNNLAELYRVKKQVDKAEPLYLEAIKILEESFGPEDIRVGVALHNFGQFYLVQNKLGEACTCYERALKIKGRVLGYDHVEYADTMYHLGRVMYLLGKEKDAEALVLDSIRILERTGQGESTCVRRLRYLAQVYLKSNRVVDAENVQRKILHIMELSKGWDSLETVFCAEQLGLTLLSAGELKEAQELLERCLNARKALLPEDHIQIGANMLHIALVKMLKVNQLSKTNVSEALSVLDNAEAHLEYSARVATQVSQKLAKQIGKNQNYGASQEARRDGSAALIILLKSLDALGVLETTKHEVLQSQKEGHSPNHEAQNALFRCISAYKEFEHNTQISDSRQVKVEYLSCLKHLLSLINGGSANRSKGPTLQELKDEIERIEAKISRPRN